MPLNKVVLYGLFSVCLLCGFGGGFLQQQTIRQAPLTDAVWLNRTPKVLIDNSAQPTHLLSYEAISVIRLKKPYLIIGSDSLEYQTVLLAGIPLYIPVKPTVWQNYWTALLGDSEPGHDEQRWLTARQQWISFVQPELDSLRAKKTTATLSLESQLCHALIKTVVSNPGLLFFVHNKSLESVSSGLPVYRSAGNLTLQHGQSATSNTVLVNGLLPLVLFGVGLTGLLYIRLTKEAVTLPEPELSASGSAESTPHELTSATDEPSETDLEAEAAKRYMQRFAERYGDFYQMLESLPEPISDERVSMTIKRQLVEMALHAQSFTRAYSLAKMQRLQSEPNVQLIMNNWTVGQLDRQQYKVFTDDPYETSKRFRVLRHVLAEMNIGRLDGALLHDVYLPAEFLVQP